MLAWPRVSPDILLPIAYCARKRNGKKIKNIKTLNPKLKVHTILTQGR